jgi:hypothetical protein
MRTTAYLTLARFTGDPDRLLSAYESSAETMDAVGLDHGLLVHAAARTHTGMLVVNLWPSRDGSLSAAADPRRLQSLAASGLSPEQIHHEHHDVSCALLGVECYR